MQTNLNRSISGVLLSVMAALTSLSTPVRAAELVDVSPQDQVSQIVQDAMAKDYLPLNYIYDATFLSHFYLALNVLSVSDVPFGIQYVESKSVNARPNLGGNDFVGWSYHAALLVMDGEDPWIVDAFVNKGNPVKRAQWLHQLYGDHLPADLILSFAEPASVTYNAAIRDHQHGPNSAKDISSLSHRVAADDLAEACKLVRQTIDATSDQNELKLAKDKRLRIHSYELAQALFQKQIMPDLEFVGDDLYGCALEP